MTMGTRAAAFTAKIRNLQDFHLRLINGIMPLPTGLDIANTLKHFSQTLLMVLKDVPHFPLEMLKSRSEDSARMQLFPNLDYKGLFNVVVQLIDVATTVQFGVQAFGQAVLQTIACILPFLEHEHIDTLPYIVASSLGTFPCSLHQDIIDLLCHYLLPFTLCNCHEQGDKSSYAAQSVSAVLMMVLQYTSSSEFHCQIMECIMSFKRDAVKDVFCVIAYGTLEARNVAINLLVFYWPHLNPTLYDRRSINFKFNGWKVPSCKSEMCSVNNSGGNADAVKICLDHSIGVSLAPENPPPLFLCQECATRLQHEQGAANHLYDVLQPVQQVPMSCENKLNCRSTEKAASAICFSAECASYNGNRPIRYCAQCHSIRHNNRRGGDHVFHLCLQSPVNNEVELLNFQVEAIVSLLLDAEPLCTRGGAKETLDQQTRLRLFTDGEFTDPIPPEERRLMGRYGIWLLVGFFSPEEVIPNDVLGRLLSVLFQWFNTTAMLGDDPNANALERLKNDVVCPWLRRVVKTSFETFVSCLLPHPPEFARVGGHWDVISSRTFHLREGFNRLFCLVPYEVITPDIWSQIMPNWMEAMASEVPEEEMSDLKIILSKVMDPEMNPLGFDARQMYQFIAVRFHQTSHKVKEQALRWLQVLSKLEIVIPLYFIFSVFREGIRAKQPAEKVPKRGSVSVSVDNSKDVISAICQDDSRNASSLSDEEENVALHTEQQSDSELMLSSFIFMLDIILKQLELQEVEQHKGLQTLVAKDAMILLHNMVAMPWPGKHTCRRNQECQFCEMSVLWYQLALEIVQKLAPEKPSVEEEVVISPDGEFGSKPFPEAEKKLEVKAETKPSVSPKSESMGLEGIIVNMPQILTATVETVSELDLAPIMPSEKIVKAVARAVTITESDTASATAHVSSASAMLINEEGGTEGKQEETGKDFWITSVGKFKFSIDELPPYLQFTYELLKKTPDEEDSELLYHLLKCLKILFLHGEVMLKASKDHRGFLIWCQENLLIKNLWELMDAEYSQICEQAVPILLHCITLPVGSDVFWRLIEEDFHSPDWRCRFTAVERVITVTRFMDSHPIRNSQPLQTALSNAFCYAISSLDDPHVAVAQRTSLYLGTIHDSAMQSLLYCLESQFDTVVVDRPVILQSLYLLLNSVSDRKILRWDFFLNCFDTLFIEAQMNLERSGEVTFLRDFKNYDTTMNHFIKKLNRIQEAMYRSDLPQSQAAGLKTLYSSLGKKWRTASVPTFSKHEKEKFYCRQSSAPVLKRKGSRHGLDGHIHSLLNMDDSYLNNFLPRLIEFEETDKDTIHLLVFLFMQFLSRYNRSPIPSENKPLARTQLAVLRHVTMLLGYNPQDKVFFLNPGRLRSSPVFNSFLSNLPQVLDQNFNVGATLISTSLTVLHYCPAPNRTAGGRAHPYFTLWLLEKHVRRHWLSALIVILYKYEYAATPLSTQIQTVVRIILNTLNCIEHRCRPIPATSILDESQRYMSQATLHTGDLEHIVEHETPPPTTPAAVAAAAGSAIVREQRKSVSSISSVKHSKGRAGHGTLESFEMMSSTETDEIEPELAAIPESPKSQESLEETGSCRDLVLMETEAIHGQAVHVAVAHQVHPAAELQVLEGLQPFGVVQSESAKVVVQSDVMPTSGGSALAAIMQAEARSRGTGPGHWFLGGVPPMAAIEPDAKSSSSATSSSSGKDRGSALAKCGQDFPWHLSVQAAFQIAKIPAPPLERLLPVGFNPNEQTPLSPTVKHLGRSSTNSPYESPESPMSRMDMITIGPTVRIDDGGVVDQDSGNQFRFNTAETTLERPPVERLLSLGQTGEKTDSGTSDDHTKGSNKAESFGHVSPKKLVKQPCVTEPDNVFEFKVDDKRPATGQQQDGKSVAFMSDPVLQTKYHHLKQSSLRIGEECVQERCSDCGTIIEVYGNEELGLCIVALETFIHKEPGLAAPFLPDIIKCATRIALKPLYPWQAESNIYVPSSVSRVAHQFLRCVLHQLAPYGVFSQLFQTKFPDRVKVEVFKAVSFALTDFNELNPAAPLQLLFEALNSKKTLVMDLLVPVIDNVATYLECLPLETASSTWSAVIPLYEAFLRKILPLIQSSNGVDGLLRSMACLMRLPGISAFKSILDPFSKILSFVIQNCSMKYHALTELCYLCHRGFTREREKLLLTRVAVFELVQALKFKSNIPDSNFLMLVTVILQDSGGSLAPYVHVDDFPKFQGEAVTALSTSAAECMRQHLTDSIEFLADFHSLSKIKSNYRGNGCGLNEDTLGGVIKGGISQFIALEISRGTSRENRAIGRVLPWLYNPPSSIQQGPKEFLDCVAHIRVLSWLLLGSLTHTAMFGPNSNTSCVPIPLEASCHVADHVHVIMTGFAEQSKSSVLHMSSLFHAFILCQVWTVYLEQSASLERNGPSQPSTTDPLNVSTNILTDFWGKVTPAVLQLISHSKVLAEMVNLHFLSLLESLLECNSSVFCRLLPLWSPLLYAHSGQLPGHVQVRLQTCINYPPPETGVSKLTDDETNHGRTSKGVTRPSTSSTCQSGGIEFPSSNCGPVHNLLLLKWVQRLQFKMGQIELQSSAATQFYPL